MKVKPMYDRVLLKRLEEQEVVKGGIIIPDTAKEKPLEAEVIAVGKGRIEGDKVVPLEVKAGDKVLIGKFSGTEVTVDGVEHVIVREEEILAKIS
jgi:chaperonin GroES